MRVTLHEVSEIQRRLTIEMPAEEAVQALDQAYQKIQKEAKLKGFRPGKAPRSVLEQYYRQDAESEAIRSLIGASYAEAVDEVGILPVSMPQVTIKAFGDGRDFSYEAVVEVRPTIDVQGYRGLKLTKDKVTVTDEEIETQLKELQERLAQIIPVGTPRRAQAGDLVTLDYQGFEGVQPLVGISAKDYVAELGRGALLPDFEKGLLEMSLGEKKRVHVTFPPESADNQFAGKSVAYEVHLKEVKEKKLPELTDEFAKDLGKFQTLAEVRAEIRGQIEKNKEQAARNKLHREILQLLVKENKFLVPEGLIQLELEESLHRLEANLKSQGVTLEQVGIQPKDYFEKNREEAILRVQGDLLFDAIAQKEGIVVTDEMADQKIEEMARQAGAEPAAWKRHYREKNQLSAIKMVLRGEKTLDFVLGEAKIKVKE